MAEVDVVKIPTVTQPVVGEDVATMSKLIKTTGLPTDAAATQTDATSVTWTSILKQISKTLQAAAAAVATGFFVKTAPQGYGAAVSYARPGDTALYGIGDVIGTSTGSTAALTFAIGPSGGGEVMITGVSLETDASTVIAGEAGYRLHLYNVTPPSALGDNAQWDLPSGDRASYLGYIDLGQPADFGSTAYVEYNGVNKQVTLLGANVYGYLTTIASFTPASGTVRKVTLHSTVL